MRRVAWIAAALLAAAIAAAGGAAWAESAPQDTAATVPKDTAAVAPAPQAPGTQEGGSLSTLAAGLGNESLSPQIDTLAGGDRFAPTNLSYVRASDIDVTLGSKLDITIIPGPRWSLSNSILFERKRYRSRDMEDVMKSLVNHVGKVEPGRYMLGINFGEMYSKKKTFGSERFGQDIIFDNQSADVKVDFTKPLLRSKSSLLSTMVGIRRGTNDFKYDKSISGSMSGTVHYAVRDILNLTGGFGTARKRENSEIGIIKFGAMPSNSDTLRANAGFGRGDRRIIDVSYNRYEGIERRVMPPLGNSYEVLDDPTKAKKEEAKKSGRELVVLSSMRPFTFLGVDFDFKHSEDSQKYRVDQRLSMETENTSLDAAATYLYARSGSMRINVSTSEDKIDYGPVSLSSYKEREHKINMGLSQKLGDSLSVTMNGTAFLKQRFYLKRDQSPRDADYVFYHGDVTLKAVPIHGIATDVVMSADRYEAINIDRSISGDNRVDYQYRVAPMITFRPARWLALSQEYAIKIEFTDFVYTEDNNFLNRTTTLGTKANFSLFRGFSLGIRHSYLMKDTGSYLMREGERRYSKSSGSVEHSLFLDATYQMMPDLAFRAATDFRNQQNNYFGVRGGERVITSQNIFESGGMRLGFVKKQDLGSAGVLDLNVAYVRNYGPYITDERRRYWDVNSGLTLRF